LPPLEPVGGYDELKRLIKTLPSPIKEQVENLLEKAQLMLLK